VLDDEPVTARRKLYFSELLSDPNNPAGPTNFYITVDGAKPVLFDPNAPPAITTHQGAVEDWTIENRTAGHHEFHFHQIHFELLERNNVPVDAADRQFLDMVQVPYWTGSGTYRLGNLSQRHCAHGFLWPRYRRFRLSLPYPGPRGQWHDSHYSCFAIAMTQPRLEVL
jgi:FtsP/CotA-like multicopper oxidase with cupredoxin domain